MRNLLNILDFSTEELDELIKVACDIAENPEKYREKCRGKKLAALFFEPSTRTRLSFESAMLELGGSVIGVSGAGGSSVSKGESVADTIRVVSYYADIIAMRHPQDGAPYVAIHSSRVPLINAGDGSHNHPTQTLADLMTIYRRKGHFDNLTIGFCGDLKYGRTVHSLVEAMSRYENVKFIFISPEELRLPGGMRRELERLGIPYEEKRNLEDSVDGLDVLYMTRIQRERFPDMSVYERLKDCYVLTEDKLKNAGKDMCVLHPLPRVNEISREVDDDRRAAYFEQVQNGKYMRMSLILRLLSEDTGCNKKDDPENRDFYRGLYTCSKLLPKPGDEPIVGKYICRNARCITNTEQQLPQLFLFNKEKNVCRCAYCEAKITL